MSRIDDYLNGKFPEGADYYRVQQLTAYVKMAIEAINRHLVGGVNALEYRGTKALPYCSIDRRLVEGDDNSYVVEVVRPNFHLNPHRYYEPYMYAKADWFHFWLQGEVLHFEVSGTTTTLPEPYTGEYSEDLILWIIQCFLGDVP